MGGWKTWNGWLPIRQHIWYATSDYSIGLSGFLLWNSSTPLWKSRFFSQNT
jgi:hypothetical protein